MNIKKKLILVMFVVMSAFGMSANAENQPTYGSAVVDGVTNEWNLNDDLFSKMCENGNIDHSTGNCNTDHLSNLYLRYNCSTNTMYALVLMEGHFWPDKNNNEAWIKIDNNLVAGGNPIPNGSEFSWFAPNGIENYSLIGYEASFPLMPNSYNIEAKINIKPSRISLTGQQTDPLNISIQCNGTPSNSGLKIEKFYLNQPMGYIPNNYDITGNFINTADNDYIFTIYRVTNNGPTLRSVHVNDMDPNIHSIMCYDPSTPYNTSGNIIYIMPFTYSIICTSFGHSQAGLQNYPATVSGNIEDIYTGTVLESFEAKDDSHYFGLVDTTPPSCEITSLDTNANEEAFIQITVSDIESGLSNIVVTKDINNSSITGINDFTPGATYPVIITATKDNQDEISVVELQVTDVEGNVTLCDPVITVETRETGKPVTHTFTDIPKIESNINIKNSDSGIKNMEIVVNGDKYQIAGLKDNDEVTIDVSDSMIEGDNNIVSLTAKGKPGGSAIVVISD